MPWYVLFSNYTGRAIHAFLQSNHTLRYMQTHAFSPHTCLKRDDFVSYTFSKHRSTTDERFADSHTRVFGKERALFVCPTPSPSKISHICFVLFVLFRFVSFCFVFPISFLSSVGNHTCDICRIRLVSSHLLLPRGDRQKSENPFYRKNKKDTTAWLNKVWTQIHKT